MTAAIVKEKVELDVADGTRMAALCGASGRGRATSGAAGFQEAFGVNHHIRSVAERFAAEVMWRSRQSCFIAPRRRDLKEAIRIFLR